MIENFRIGLLWLLFTNRRVLQKDREPLFPQRLQACKPDSASYQWKGVSGRVLC